MKSRGTFASQSLGKKLICGRLRKKLEFQILPFIDISKTKNDLKAELIRRGFQLIYEGIKNVNVDNNFIVYGANYVKFGIEYPHIYDLMFGYTIDIDMSLYPDLDVASNESFNGVVQGVKSFMPNNSENEVMIKAYNIWASVHGLVGILRRSEWRGNKTETLEWIENNLEEYLKMTTFG